MKRVYENKNLQRAVGLGNSSSNIFLKNKVYSDSLVLGLELLP